MFKNIFIDKLHNANISKTAVLRNYKFFEVQIICNNLLYNIYYVKLIVY